MNSVAEAPFGFMPLLRTGDLLFNAFVLRHRMIGGGTPVDTVKEMRGTGGMYQDVFGGDAAAVTRRVFGPDGSVKDTLARHTVLGAYLGAMSHAAERACVQSQTQGNRNDVMHRLGLGSGRGSSLTTPCLRSCVKCIASDDAKQGYPSWRVLHQLSALGRCPEHGEPLHIELKPTRETAGKPRLWPFRLPGEDLTDVSPASNTLPMSEGYAAYLELWKRVFAGELPAVRPAAWYELINLICVRLGGIARARRELEDVIVKSWQVSLDHIARHLSLGDSASFVGEELELASQPKDLARRLVVYAAAKQAAVVVEEHEQLALGRSELTLAAAGIATKSPRQQLHERLWAIVVTVGYPLSLTDALFEDVGIAEVARMAKLSAAVVRKIVKGLPTDLLLDLATTQRMSRASWLGHELARRKLTGRAAWVSAPSN